MFATKFADLQNNHYLCGVQAFGWRLNCQPATFLCQRFRLTIAKIQTLFVPSKYLFVF